MLNHQASARRAKAGGEDEEIGKVDLTIAIEIVPGVISILTERESVFADKENEVGEIHLPIAIEIG